MKFDIRSLILPVCSVLLLSACGGGEEKENPTASPTPKPASPTPGATASPSPTSTPNMPRASMTPEPSTPSSTPEPPVMTPKPRATPTPQVTPMPTPIPTDRPFVSAPLTRVSTEAGEVFSVDDEVAILAYSQADGPIEQVAAKSGFSLYTSDDDALDDSSCLDEACISNWSPLLANALDSASEPFSIIDRDDGYLQWAVWGKALYFYALDASPGDILGDNKDLHRLALTQPTVSKGTENDASGIYLASAGKVLSSNRLSNKEFEALTQNKLEMSLYTFDKDQPGNATCNDGCLDTWPALLAYDSDVAAEPYSIIERQLGTNGPMARQWALDGKPLYFYSGDSVPGDTNGASVASWRLARPAAAEIQ